MQMQKLDNMGDTIKPSERPVSKIGQNTQMQVGVKYGHNGSGKVYNYLAGDNKRVGDYVTPEVTHPKSGKTYNTMAQIVYTRKADSPAAQATAGYLSGKGIMMKTIGGTDQRALPGYKERKSQDESFTIKKWKQEADEQYHNEVMARLGIMG